MPSLAKDQIRFAAGPIGRSDEDILVRSYSSIPFSLAIYKTQLSYRLTVSIFRSMCGKLRSVCGICAER